MTVSADGNDVQIKCGGADDKGEDPMRMLASSTTQVMASGWCFFQRSQLSFTRLALLPACTPTTGQLGDGTKAADTTPSPFEAQKPFDFPKKVIALAAGHETACAMLESKTVTCK